MANSFLLRVAPIACPRCGGLDDDFYTDADCLSVSSQRSPAPVLVAGESVECALPFFPPDWFLRVCSVHEPVEETGDFLFPAWTVCWSCANYIRAMMRVERFVFRGLSHITRWVWSLEDAYPAGERVGLLYWGFLPSRERRNTVLDCWAREGVQLIHEQYDIVYECEDGLRRWLDDLSVDLGYSIDTGRRGKVRDNTRDLVVLLCRFDDRTAVSRVLDD